MNYKRVNLLIQILIATLISIQLLVYVVAEDDIFGKESGAGVTKDVDFQQSFEREVQQTIDSGGSIDLGAEKYKSNEALVRQVLKDKYGIDFTGSFQGARIEAGKLSLPGGTEIDLTSGKTITLNSNGATVSSMTDGETTVVGAVGVEYDGKDLNVNRAQRVKYQDTESENVRKYSGTEEKITIISADLVVSNENIISQGKTIEITKNGKETYNFVCAGNTQSTISKIKINCRQGKKVKAEVQGKTTVLTLEKDTEFSYKNIEGKVDENNAKLEITELSTNEDEITIKGITTKFEKR